MITLKCIEIYEKYGGNEDGFLRCATSEERLLLNYSCWILLDEFVQDLIITLDIRGWGIQNLSKNSAENMA